MRDSEIIATSAVVDAIKQSTDVQKVELQGQTYLSKQTFLPPSEAKPPAIQAHTLNSLQSYIEADNSFDIDEQAIAHICSPSKVALVSPLTGRNNQRYCFLMADCSGVNESAFRFGQFVEPEKFIIGLLSQFEDSGDRAMVLQLVGGLRSENVSEANDDGFSQSVSVRKGVASVQRTDVPSIVNLAPYRTFREIDQPISKFLLRFRQGSGDKPEVGLFEADGGSWKLAAIEAIADYLRPALSELQVPLIF